MNVRSGIRSAAHETREHTANELRPGTATSAWHRAGSRGAGSRWRRPARHWRAAGGQPEAGIRDLCNLITIAALFDYVLLSQTQRPDPAAGRWGPLLEGAMRRCPEER